LAPTFTADFGFSYRHASGFDLSADARYTGEYFSSIKNDPDEEIDPFWVLNAQAGYVFGADENVRIFGFVNNLLDADDPTLIEEGATSADDALYILHPRSFGVGVEAHF
jgi:outer membrane receptor protein involved in Fe transport